MKRILFLSITLLILFNSLLFSQEVDNSLIAQNESTIETTSTTKEDVSNQETIPESDTLPDESTSTDDGTLPDNDTRSPDFLFFTFGASAMMNGEGSGVKEMNIPADGGYGGFQSAPSPIYFSPGVGLSIPRVSFVSFGPHLKFSLNYYLWNGKSALPAEIEHRTAITPSIMLDLPAVFRFNVVKSVFTVGAGVGLFIRYGFLAQGVTGDTVDSDVSNINTWFWSDLHFLYPMALFSWDYNFEIGWRIGLDLRAYYPIANAINPSPYGKDLTNILDTGIVSFAIRITPPFKNWK